MAIDKLTQQLYEALVEAEGHLDYTGYGDSWERECADIQKLPEKIEQALKAAREAGIKTSQETKDEEAAAKKLRGKSVPEKG